LTHEWPHGLRKVALAYQVCAEVAIVILDENTPASRSWFTWRDILHLVDIICCCAILFPIVWSIKHLREAAGVRFQPLLGTMLSLFAGNHVQRHTACDWPHRRSMH